MRVRASGVPRRVAATLLPAVAAAAILAGTALAGDGQITTVAGGGTLVPGDGGAATAAKLGQPRGIALEAGGSLAFVEFTGQRLRRLATSGTIGTVAGTGAAGYSGDSGPAAAAALNSPSDVIAMPSGPYQGLLIADQSNHRIRRIAPSGTITTVAGTGVAGKNGDGGPATAAHLRNPRGLSPTPDGGFLIADEMNSEIRQVSPGGTITRVAGTGTAGTSADGTPATSAALNRPLAVESLGAGDFLIADGYNDCVRRVTAGVITTVAGICGGGGAFAGDGGPATAARLSRPRDVLATGDGGYYIADSLNQRVRRVAPDGIIGTVAGTGTASFAGDGGPALAAKLNQPSNLAFDAAGALMIADTSNNRVRRVVGPLPVLGGMSPTSAAAGSGGITLSVTGTGFPAGATVFWNGQVRPTTRISSTALTATIPAGDLSAPGTATVSVRASAAGGDATQAATFTINPEGSGGAVQPPAGNLTRNFSFESGASGWTCFQCALAAVALPDAPAGTQAAQVTLRPGFTSMALDDSPDTVASSVLGTTYTASAYVKAADPSSVGRPIRLYVRERDAAGATVQDKGSPGLTLTDTFQPITMSATALGSGHRVDMRLSHSAAAAGNAFYADALSMTASAPAANQPPTASFTVSPSPTAGQPVTFTDTSTDADGSLVARAWDADNDGQFNDGTGTTAQWTFAAGTYTVRLQVTDDQGATAIASQQITVAPSGGGGGGGGTLQPPAGNLTKNFSFESGLTGWSCYQCTLAQAVLGDAPAGTAAAQVTLRSGFTSMAIDDSPDTIASTVAGRSYSATAYVKAADPSSIGKPVRIYLREKDAANKVVQDVGSAAFPLTSAFQPVTVTATTLAAADKMDVRVGATGAVLGNAFYADAISVVATN